MSDKTATLGYILKDKGYEFIKRFGDKLASFVVSALIQVLNCRNESNGYRSFFCVECGLIKRIPFSCKSRLCPRCAQRANQHFAIEFVQKMLPVTHRHITLTIPKMLWELFHKSKELQKGLLRAAYQSVKEIMEMYLKIEVVPGAICVLNNFGRDLKKNCHVHMIVTEGGRSRSGNWIRFTYFPFVKEGKIHKTLNELWEEKVLELLRLHLPRTLDKAMFLEEIKTKYPDGFYVNAPKESRIKTNKTAYNKAKYITRYVKHPPISDRRIESYDGEHVKIWYEHPSTKELRHVRMDVFDFIEKVVCHLPEKGMNMVVRYGLYSPSYSGKIEIQMIFAPNGNVTDPKELSWRELIIIFTGKDPLCCKYCQHEMIHVCTVYKRRDKLKVRYHLFDDDLAVINYPDEEEYYLNGASSDRPVTPCKKSSTKSPIRVPYSP